MIILIWRRFPIVMGLVAIIIFVFILEFIDYASIAIDLALWPRYLADYRVYTLFTSMFLHASLIHIIFNLFALFFIGSILERRIGVGRFLIIYVIAGLVGGLVWAGIHWNDAAYALGASGAIMGVLGGFARLYGREKLRIFLFLFPMPPMPAYMIFILVLIIDLVIAITHPVNIAAEAHIGGAITGFLIAPYVMKIPSRTKQKREIQIHHSTLKKLATTPELKDALQKIEQEDEPEIRSAWFTHFMQRARCPKCGGALRISGNTIYSDCGWKMNL